jgi:hypothetical protein
MEVFNAIRAEITSAQAMHAEQADKHCSEGQVLKTGDCVWIGARNTTTQACNKKLDCKHLGFYEILEVISPWANRLQLPKDIHIHPGQLISRLYKSAENPLPGQVFKPSPPIIVNGKDQYEVEIIEDLRLCRKQLRYLGQSNRYEEHSWQSATNEDGRQTINICHTELSGKPGSVNSLELMC